MAELTPTVLVEPDAAPARVEHVLAMARIDNADPDIELIRALNKARNDPSAVARELLDDADFGQAGR